MVSSSMVRAVDDVTVRCEDQFHIAALRYFDSAGSFTDSVLEVLGTPVPELLRATMISAADDALQLILAWRSATETLILSRDLAVFRRLQQRLTGLKDGCMVEQTGGICVLRVQGRRATDLLLRLGAVSCIPEPGAALTGRMAELQMLTLCVRAGEYLLLVERVYADHLREWISRTAADF